MIASSTTSNDLGNLLDDDEKEVSAGSAADNFLMPNCGEELYSNMNLMPNDFSSSTRRTQADDSMPTNSMANNFINRPPSYNTNLDAQSLEKPHHQTAWIFHSLFKVCAVLIYVSGGWFSESFVTVFVLCILCLSFDFWIVKNVTGRLLVGLRWWNDNSTDSNNSWRFESIDNPDSQNTMDYRVFWYSQYVHFAIWALFAFLDSLSLKLLWMMLTFVALGLVGTNIYAYVQCSKDAKTQLQGFLRDHTFRVMSSNFASSFSSWGRTDSTEAAPPTAIV